MSASDRTVAGMTDVPKQPLVIKAEEFGKLLQISERSIWRLNSSGEIPKPIRIGGSVRWRREEVIQWVEAGCPPKGS